MEKASAVLSVFRSLLYISLFAHSTGLSAWYIVSAVQCKNGKLSAAEIKHNVEIIWLRWENGQPSVIGHVMDRASSKEVASDGDARVVNNPSCGLKCLPTDSRGHPPQWRKLTCQSARPPRLQTIISAYNIRSCQPSCYKRVPSLAWFTVASAIWKVCFSRIIARWDGEDRF